MKAAIKRFDLYLNQRKLSFEAIVIGGAALVMMDVITRATRDVDFLDPLIPEDIKMASIQFARQNLDLKLNPNTWINNGPYPLKHDLPSDWRNNLQTIFKGTALTIRTLGRMDLLRTKLYACVDRDIDFQDCIALAPTLQELKICKKWVLQGDLNPEWPNRVEEVFAALTKELQRES